VLRRLGYASSPLSLGIPANRTCRIENATPERLRELIADNLLSLRRVLQYNHDRSVRLLRIGSDLVPFGAHPVNRVPWWREFAADLSDIAALIRDDDVRVSMHPGQFTVMNSPSQPVVDDAVRELEYHARVLDALETPPSAKIVIPIGGAYGTHQDSMERFVSAYRTLPSEVRRRLAIENDDRVFSAAETLSVGAATQLPVVFDWLHHRRNPGVGDPAALVRRCFQTWGAADAPPLVQVGSQAQTQHPGQQAEWIAVADYLAFDRLTPPEAYDCLLEAKGRDLALFRLREQLRERGIIEPVT
jgi:UV DNA damage endonuclease